MADPHGSAETHSHMSYVITAVVFAIAGFVVGLVVGRKNPSIANAATAATDSVDALLKKKS